jgi:hypothetical protein
MRRWIWREVYRQRGRNAKMAPREKVWAVSGEFFCNGDAVGEVAFYVFCALSTAGVLLLLDWL